MENNPFFRQLDEMGRLLIPKAVRDILGFGDYGLAITLLPDRQGIQVAKAKNKDAGDSVKTLAADGRLQIPAELRQQLHWEKGKPIEGKIEDEHIVFQQHRIRACAVCGADYSLLEIKGSFLCEECLAAGNRVIIARWHSELERLVSEYRAYCESCLAFEDVEDVHQARASGRRIETLLRFLEVDQDHILMNRLRQAHKQLGKVRECDVLMQAFDLQAERELIQEHAGVYRDFSGRAGQQRKKYQIKLAAKLPAIINDAFNMDWTRFLEEQLENHVLALNIAERLEQLEQMFAAHVGDYRHAADENGNNSKSALKALHAVRIEAKSLHYIYSYLNGIYDSIYKTKMKKYKRYQRELGEINDIHDWLNTIKNNRKKAAAPAEHIQEVIEKLSGELHEQVERIDLQLAE